jgi:hypothetical protein
MEDGEDAWAWAGRSYCWLYIQRDAHFLRICRIALSSMIISKESFPFLGE